MNVKDGRLQNRGSCAGPGPFAAAAGDEVDRYRFVFDNMKSGAVIYRAVDDGADFLIVDCNRAAEGIEKIARSALLGRLVTEVFPGVAAFGLLDVLQRVWRTGAPEHHPSAFYQDSRIFGWRDNYVYRLASDEVVTVYDDVTAQKSMEDELRKKKDLLDIIVNTFPDILCLKDGEGRWLLANQFVLELFGLTLVDYVGKTDAELAPYSPFYRNAFLACMDTDQEAWGKKAPSRGQEVIPRPDGEAKIFDIVKVPLFNPDGSRHALVVAGRDITALLTVQASLRRREEFLRMLIATTPEGYVRVSADGEIVEVNDSLCRMLGFVPEELRGANVLLFVEEGDAARFTSLLRRPAGSSGHYAVNLRKKSGERVYALCSPSVLPVQAEAPGGAFVFFSDITARRHAEERNRESERRFRLLFHHLPFPYQSLDENGRLIDVNRKWLSVLGYSRGEVLGQAFADFLSSPFRSHFERSFVFLKKEGVARNVEFEMVKKDGSIFLVSFDGRILRRPDGGVEKTFCVFRDITKQKRLDEMLLRSHQVLEQEVRKRTEELRRKGREQQKTLLALQQKSQELQEANTALKVLLEQSGRSRQSSEEKIAANLKELVVPYLDELALRLQDRSLAGYIDILRQNIETITSSFSRQIASSTIGLTPRELQVANLIRQGRSNKEIGELLHLSSGTVGVYRNSIREKLGIKSKKINLRSYLLSHE